MNFDLELQYNKIEAESDSANFNRYLKNVTTKKKSKKKWMKIHFISVEQSFKIFNEIMEKIEKELDIRSVNVVEELSFYCQTVVNYLRRANTQR